MQPSLEQLLTSHQFTRTEQCTQPPDLSGKDLTEVDLSGLDLSGVNLTGANLTRARLEGTRLQAATLLHACFEGIRIGTLLAAGLTPRFVFQHRAEADRTRYPALHFSSCASASAPFQLTAHECTRITQHVQDYCWEQLTDEAVFTALYPNDCWDNWMARCQTRQILTWALAHRAFLQRTAPALPFYGRVLPLSLVDEIEERELVAGSKTNPERVFHALGIRQLLAQSDLQGDNVTYPLAPFGDADEIGQIKDRLSLQLEGGLMHHCVAGYDHQCRTGQCFIYHVGPAAPLGSTLQLFPDGSVGQHRAERNRAPSIEDRRRVTLWLTSLGIAYDGRTVLERVCERLCRANIVHVSFQIYWYEDEDCVADVIATDQEGKGVEMLTVSDEDLWELVRETHGETDGQWELCVAEQALDWLDESIPPEDEDDEWEDEEEDEETDDVECECAENKEEM